jgi:glycosyltransferase involved in cell wall biosynthesis
VNESTAGIGSGRSRVPKLQIGLPVYNGENYLDAAIASLLEQTFGDFELIVSDNGSTDATEEIARARSASDPRVRYHRYETNRGASWNWNNSFALSASPYFKWAAHDDLHEPTFVERCLEVLDAEPTVGMCYTASRYIDETGAAVPARRSCGCHLRQERPSERLRGFFGTYPMHVLFGVVRRDVLARTRGMLGIASADRLLVGELALAAQIHEIDDTLFVRRFHPEISWFLEMTEREYAAWYDPSNADRFSVPILRRGVEYASAVRHHDVSGAEAARCYLEVARYATWDHGLIRLKNYATAAARRGGELLGRPSQARSPG